MASYKYSFFLVCFIFPLTHAVSIDITLFNTTVQFSDLNSCFAAVEIDRDCRCDKLCIKHQDCCLDYEIWRASNSSFDSKISNDVVSNWTAFLGAINSTDEKTLNIDFQQTFHELEKLIMGRKENLVEFTCNTNVVDCGNTSCDVFKILIVGKCDKRSKNGSKECGGGDYDLVYDERTELVFLNRQCALCNFVDPEHIIPFVKMVVFEDDDFLSDDDLKDTPRAMEIIANSNSNSNVYQVLPPSLETYRRCQPKQYGCDVEASDLLTKACLAYQGGIGCFANPHCEQCSDTYYDSYYDSYYLSQTEVGLCSFDLGSSFEKPSFAIFIDTSGGLTRVYPTTRDDKMSNKQDSDEVVSPIFDLPFSEDTTKQDDALIDQEQRVTAVYSDISFAITLTGTILSIISIIIALFTFYISPAMRNTSGWINILLLITILISCVLYLLLLIDIEVPPACRAVAIAKHFFLLCTFCWTNCLGLNVFLSTKPKPVFSKEVQKKLFWYYCLYSFCTPALVVCCCVAVEYSSIEVATIYEYSDCFLTNKAKLLAFIVPISIMMLLNATLFAIIIRNIKKKSHVTKEESALAKKKRQKFEVILSIKICCAFALYWIFGIIASSIVTIREETTTASLVFNMIFVFTASMQGVFVCVAVVFNKRVIKMWRKKLIGSKPKIRLQKV